VRAGFSRGAGGAASLDALSRGGRALPGVRDPSLPRPPREDEVARAADGRHRGTGGVSVGMARARLPAGNLFQLPSVLRAEPPGPDPLLGPAPPVQGEVPRLSAHAPCTAVSLNGGDPMIRLELSDRE